MSYDCTYIEVRSSANCTKIIRGFGGVLICAMVLICGNLRAAELDYIEVGPMYMAYFSVNTANGTMEWRNSGDYQIDGPQVLKPMNNISSGDYYVGDEPWVNLLNPHELGGQGAAYSRLFGFSLEGGARSYLNANGYALAIHLDSISFVEGGAAAGNTSVYYYNRGNDDWGSYHDDKKEFSELENGNYLIWNGQSFSNMIHLLVASTDPFATEYKLQYTLSIVQDTTSANVNATVVDEVLRVAGFQDITFSYNAQNVGALIPESGTYALFVGIMGLGFIVLRKRLQG